MIESEARVISRRFHSNDGKPLVVLRLRSDDEVGVSFGEAEVRRLSRHTDDERFRFDRPQALMQHTRFRILVEKEHDEIKGHCGDELDCFSAAGRDVDVRSLLPELRRQVTTERNELNDENTGSVSHQGPPPSTQSKNRALSRKGLGKNAL